MGQWKVIVVDDHQLMLEAVRAALAGEDEFEIVAEAGSGAAALELARQHSPDLVLLDLRMPGMSGIECIKELKADHPRAHVVVLSGVDEPMVVRQAIDAGASAFISKLVDARDLASTLRQVIEGTVVSPAPALPEGDGPTFEALTERELAVLRHAAAGAPNKEIGRLLCVSEQTVKYHLSRIYDKFGVAGRVDAVRFAVARNLVGVDSPRQQ